MFLKVKFCDCFLLGKFSSNLFPFFEYTFTHTSFLTDAD
jgi:hypothetical protein